MKIRLDHAGIEEILKSDPVRSEIRARAETAAQSLRSEETVQRHGAEVEVEDYTTDRAAVAVWVKHPGAAGMQAKYGIFSRAGSAAGVGYRSREG